MMQFAAKVVPTLNGVDPRRISGLWGPFLLVNAGCFLRVASQTLTDWSPAPYAVIGLSGTMEVAGLAWWGAGLASLMIRGAYEAGDPGPGSAPERIVGGHHPADVLDWFPETAAVFDRFGMDGLRRPALRRTLGRRTTLDQAARLRGIAPAELAVGFRAVALVAGLQDDLLEARREVAVERIALLLERRPGIGIHRLGPEI